MELDGMKLSGMTQRGLKKQAEQELLGKASKGTDKKDKEYALIRVSVRSEKKKEYRDFLKRKISVLTEFILSGIDEDTIARLNKRYQTTNRLTKLGQQLIQLPLFDDYYSVKVTDLEALNKARMYLKKTSLSSQDALGYLFEDQVEELMREYDRE